MRWPQNIPAYLALTRLQQVVYVNFVLPIYRIAAYGQSLRARFVGLRRKSDLVQGSSYLESM